MTVAPEPFTPSDCDVRNLDGFMLNVEKLMASELWAISTGEEFKAALALWCRAWKQVPAASLPNDERVLMAFSGAGARWKKVRDVALRGFVLCSDGRLYHPVLAADAIRAAKARQQRRDAINARYGKGTERDDPKPPTHHDKPTAVATAVDGPEARDFYQRRDGTETGRKKEKIVVDDDEARARAKFDLAAATERVIAAAGADPSKQAGWMMASVSVGKWLARGADLELDILPTIGAVAVSREGRGPPNSPSYFDRAIVEAMGNRLKPLPDVLPSKPRNGNRPQPVDTLDVETARWKARVTGWVKSRIWREADWGPPPDDPDCWAPAVLLVDLHQRGAA